MPLVHPILDSRTYEEIRRDLVRRIPVYNPEWSDHNASDPGITLLELFSFLGENLLFHFNQIPEATRLAFLELLQIPLRPASPASAMLALSTKAASGVLVERGSAARAGKVPFETQNEVHVWPVRALAAAKHTAPQALEDLEPEVRAAIDFARDALKLGDGDAEALYETEVLDPESGASVLDLDATVDGALWIAVLDEDGADLEELADGVLNIGFAPEPILDGIEDVDPCPGEGVATSAPAVEWLVSTPVLEGEDEPVFVPLQVVGDTTGGLQREGVVRLRLPRTAESFGPVPLPDPDLAGGGGRPPVLEDELDEKVLFWLQAFRRDGSRLGAVAQVVANACAVLQVERARAEFLGTGSGQPAQSARLVHAPVLAESLVLEVEEPGGWVRWSEVDGFHASSPEDRHFVLDRESGTVRFGSGARGRVPQIGERLRANEYLYGGGPDGNVVAGSISKLPAHADVDATNPKPARGGSAPEGVGAALERIPGELRRRERAVTRDDFAELALATPGGEVARAECLPRFDATTLRDEQPGVVTVVVWPTEDPERPDAPLPDRALLRRVCAQLDRRRLVTTELYVAPPTYREIAVSVGVRAKPGHGIEAIRRWVELVLRQYLAPLPPYGPEGGGWPLGRRVYAPELEAAALSVEGVEFLEPARFAVEGVEYVQALTLAFRDPDSGAWVRVLPPEAVELGRHEVPALVEITVLEGPPLADPSAGLDAPRPTPSPIPIPVVRDEC